MLPLYLHDLGQCNLFLFPKLKMNFEKVRSEMWRTLKEIRRLSFTLNQKGKLRGTSNTRNRSGISGLNAKGTILKKIKVLFITYFCLVKYNFSLNTFRLHLSYYNFLYITFHPSEYRFVFFPNLFIVVFFFYLIFFFYFFPYLLSIFCLLERF